MEEQDKEQHKIEALQKEIYGRTFESSAPPLRPQFKEHENTVGRGWQHSGTEEPRTIQPELPKPKSPIFKRIFIGVLIFFIFSAAILAYIFFAGWNVISENNVDLSFSGPVSVSAGTPLDVSFTIANQNSSAIENAVLYIDYPDGTKKVEDITQDLLHDKLMVGEVLPRVATTTVLHAVLFGELNAQRDIKVTLEYGLKNSNASYKKDKTYEVTISSTPLTVSVAHQQQVISNSTVDFTATITSNSSAPLTNLLMKVDYPFGFTLASTDPQPTFENSYWLIPTLAPGEQKNITIHGQLQGEQNDERVFHFSIGTQDPQNNKVIATRYLTQTESVIVQKPPLDVAVSLDGSSTPTVNTIQGSSISGSVSITNNLTDRILNPKIQIYFAGPLFDASSVVKGFGFYESTSNSLIWDKSNTAGLDALDPGQTLSFPFIFSTFQRGQTSIQNPTMTLRIVATGNRVGASGVNELITSTDAKTIQAKTSIGLVSRIVHSTGSFTNRGPIPPKVNTKTTYTIIWDATNSSNDVHGAEVHATLPSYVHWLNAVNPASETVTWNPDKNEVVWRVGDIVAGTGSSRPAREASFQVELVPSLSQVGIAPNMLSNTSMIASDAFTGSALSTQAGDLSTALPTDPAYHGINDSLVTQ